MKANESKLQPLLEGTKQYLVPLFQRSYTWKRKRWQDLWDDLLALYESNEGREHFIGAIVSMPVEMSPEGVNKFLLIDGQQRMTTLLIILAAMRDLTAGKDSKLSDQIHELYLVNKWEEGANSLKLLPSQPDRETFSCIIQRKDPGDDDNGIVKAYKYFYRKLEGFDGNGAVLDLKRLHTILMQQIMVVSVVLHKDENPYLIFESLNAKGEPLTQADLVRNYILMRINDSGDQEVAYRDLWLPMQNSLRGELTNFLWRYVNKDGTFVRQNAIYDAVKRRLAKLDSDGVVDVLMDMYTYSGYYLRLIDPEKEPNKDIRQRFARLNRWEIKTAYPFLLMAYHDYESHQLSADEMCHILDMIEAFVIRRFFCRIPANALNRIFISLYHGLDKENFVTFMQQELLKRGWPSDAQFLAGWIRFPIYSSGTAKCRHILEALEQALTKNNEPVDVTYPKITIEHIMPQTLNDVWEDILGHEAANAHTAYLHTIGNLTLTGENAPMGNEAFIQKRKVFAESNFALNKLLGNLGAWNQETILQRAKELGQMAVEIWAHPGGNESEMERASEKDDPTGYKPIGFRLFDSEYSVESWREMLVRALVLMGKRYGDSFAAKAVQVQTSRRVHISHSPDGMVKPMQIPESELWVEVNQSSRQVLWVIRQTLKVCGDQEEDFEAYW